MTSDIESPWICVTNSSTSEYHVFSKPIRKSENDDREYRLIRLGNGLEAMVIQNAGAERAAACMNVAVGFLQDPDDMPGTAHFCEHLLFMGTELYPKENEFDDYITKNGGYNNADTQPDSTIYHFNVFADSLSGALSRFASFFHCPIFDPSCTSREIIAVDSEFKRNLQNDAFRVSQVERHLSKQGHPWRKFENGTKESLIQAPCRMEAKGSFSCIPPPVDGSVSGSPSLIDIEDGTKLTEDSYIQEARRRVIEWWNNEYDANRMRLCVIGKESVEYLSDLISRLFSPIATRNLDPLPIMSVHPYGPDEVGTMLFVQTIIDIFRLDISFPIPDQSPHWRHQPASLLTHLVGHEGPGSLFSNLKRKHWARWLDAGYYILGRGSAIFKVEVGLTHSGFVHHREINLAVHQYLSFLRSSVLPAWHQSEEHALRILDFRYSEKGDPQDYAIYLTRQLSSLALPPRDQCISAPQLVEAWDPEDPMKPGGGEKEVRDILNLLTAENSRSTLWAKKDDHERISGKNTTWEHEPWYGTGYATERYDASFLRQANSAHVIPGIYLPLPNKFIPQRLDVAQQLVTLELEKQPQLIRETSLSSLWYKKVDRFRVPKSSATVLVCTPVANNFPRDRALTCLFAACVRDSLEEFAYDATLAGLFWSFWPSRLGFQFTLNGFNDKFLVLASRVLEKVRELEMNEDILCTRKQDLKRSLHNDSLEQP
ncbi:unnamed protein product [Somion occarium]|uniref:Uncharacterized protein n=1 Tax=Somion occarium TaxID=3059160 RepID=A0ABP1E4Y5_9APHY